MKTWYKNMLLKHRTFNLLFQNELKDIKKTLKDPKEHHEL